MKTDKIVIVGGGSSGWMTAATLIKLFPEKDITVIESPNISTVGVGESTLGSINQWLKILEIEDKDFMPHTDASYKMSIRFEDFYDVGDGGFHYPFGSPWEIDMPIGKELWFYKKRLFKDTPNSNYADFIYPQMALVNKNKITENLEGQFLNFNFKNDVAYHFDATKFGIWLRDHYCIPRGVKHIKEDILSVEKDQQGITSLNNKHKADLYIDCTGFKSLLLEKNFEVSFNDYTDLLPNNSAWATRIPYKNKEVELQPYTNCTAIENGWVWNIPSWERIGTGYVYSDKYISDDDALEQFKKYLIVKDVDVKSLEFKNIKMKVGIHEELFHKNVCAIGLSAGFIEPLESNGLLSVHNFALMLAKVLKRNTDITQFDRDTFNTTSINFFNSFTDFVACHYAMSNRNDTLYWQDIRKRNWTKLEKNGDITNNIDAKMSDHLHFNSAYGIHCLSTGMNYYGIDDFYKLDNEEQIKKDIAFRNKLVIDWNRMADKCPSLNQYLKENIHNK